MNILVCIKQVPDPEGPQDCFVINPDTLRVEPRGIPPVVSLFDENALEAALRIKDSHKDDTKITVISMGKRISNAVLQKALAVGADKLVKVEDDAFESGSLDSYVTASILACTIKRISEYDLILAGRQAADWNAGQVGILLAGLLEIPAITLARKVEIEDGHVIVERVIPSGYEVVRARLPAVVIASNEVGEMRYPTLIQRRDARKKPGEAWGPEDIGFEYSPKNKVVLKKLFLPQMRQGRCILIEGASPADAGKKLAHRLKDDDVI
jgi:electron transfer flavoprotein beta subunit